MRTREERLLNSVQSPGAYEEVLIESSGVPIALSVWKGNSDTPCVVFLPGTMTHPLFYEELLDVLAQAGFNVVGVHYQGHGKSPRVNQLFSLEDLVRNGFAAVDYAAEHFKSDILVLGSSQGGIAGGLKEVAQHLLYTNVGSPSGVGGVTPSSSDTPGLADTGLPCTGAATPATGYGLHL